MTIAEAMKLGPRPQDMRLLLEHILNVDRLYLIAHTEEVLTAEQIKQVKNGVQRLNDGEPITKILGVREFYSRKFKVTKHTLDPRPDTEWIIDSVLKTVESPNRILDLGTGTGCILITLLLECPKASGVGVDISREALQVAQENATKHKIQARSEFICSNWGEKLVDQFDVIVSNPPYIKTEDIHHLDRNVRDYDPFLALDGGESGLEAYKLIAADISRLLHPQGRCFIEIGIGMVEDVIKVFQQNGLQHTETIKDLSNIDRCLVFKKQH
ncbi:MAG: peptide chain release factor N(5)-glutamine methyltransferase [Alphaproteobacteria bacterium]